MDRLIKSPLLWFLLLGASLFWLDTLELNRVDHTILITEGDVQRIRDQWQAQSGKAITADMLNALIQEQVQERRLYREALALGLEREDVIVRRRLAQKLRFLTEDLAGNTEPDDAELEAYFAQHQEAYLEPARFSFRQIYFSSEKQGEEADSRAREALTELVEKDWQSLGDPFMLGRSFQDRSSLEISQQFGKSFVAELTRLVLTRDSSVSHTTQGWVGPIESPFGLHLVEIEHYRPPRTPALDEVRDRVLTNYRMGQRKLAYEHYLKTLARKYPVRIEAAKTKQ